MRRGGEAVEKRNGALLRKVGWRLEGCQEKVSDCASDPARRRCFCLCPVNWNTKQSGVDGSIGDEDGEGEPLSVSDNAQPSLLAGN